MRTICEERPRLIGALRERGFEVTDSQANFVWAAHPRCTAASSPRAWRRAGVLVAAGDALGEPRHVRIGVRSAPQCGRARRSRRAGLAAALAGWAPDRQADRRVG